MSKKFSVNLPEGEVPTLGETAAKLVLDTMFKVLKSRGELGKMKLENIQEVFDALRTAARGAMQNKLPKLYYTKGDKPLQFSFAKDHEPTKQEMAVLDYLNCGTRDFLKPLVEAPEAPSSTLPNGRLSAEEMEAGRKEIVKHSQFIFADLLQKTGGADLGNADLVTNYAAKEVAQKFLTGLAKRNGIKNGAILTTAKRSPVENTDIRDGEVVIRLDKIVIVQLLPSNNKFIALGPGDKVYEKGSQQGIDPFDETVLKIKGAVAHDSVKEEYMGRSHVQEKKRGAKMPGHSSHLPSKGG